MEHPLLRKIPDPPLQVLNAGSKMNLNSQAHETPGKFVGSLQYHWWWFISKRKPRQAPTDRFSERSMRFGSRAQSEEA